MHKKITIFLIIFLISCQSSKKDSKGNFNDLVILSSLEDKVMLESIINNNIFLDTFFTPEPEPFLNKIWITPKQFKHYKNHSNLLLISVSDPIDETIDVLINEFSKNNKIESFPVVLNDVYSSNQLITIIKEEDQSFFERKLDETLIYLDSIIKNHINNLYYSRYKSFNNDTLISELAFKLFNQSFYFREDFKIIDYSNIDDMKYLWIGRGDVLAENSIYQWLIIKDLHDSIHFDNNKILKLIQNNLNNVISDIDVIMDYNQFLFDSSQNFNIYKINTLYNHNKYKTGGPLIVFILEDKISNENKIIFGLVNAPGQNKLNAIKELESIVIKSIF